MLVEVLVLDVDGALIAHVSRRRARVLIIVAVVLSDETLGSNLPGAALGELLGVGRFPDLDLVDVRV